jgi:hypothetical protein
MKFPPAPDIWSRIHDEGGQTLENIANIRVPVIAAVEGRAHSHSDYALLASVELSGWSRSSRGIPAQSPTAASAYRARLGSRGRGRTERQGSGTRAGTGRFVPAGSGSGKIKAIEELSLSLRENRARTSLQLLSVVAG